MSEYQIRTFTDWKKELVQKNQEQKKDPNYNNEIIDVINGGSDICTIDPKIVTKFNFFDVFLHLLENHSDQITDKEWIKKMIDAYGEKYKNHDALAMMEKGDLKGNECRQQIKNSSSDFNIEATLAYIQGDFMMFKKYISLCDKAFKEKHYSGRNSAEFVMSFENLILQPVVKKLGLVSWTDSVTKEQESEILSLYDEQYLYEYRLTD